MAGRNVSRSMACRVAARILHGRLKIRFVILFLYFCAFLAVGVVCRYRHRRIDMRPARHVDLVRYMGRWHEVARCEWPFDRPLCDIELRYVLRSNGRIELRTIGTDRRPGHDGLVRHETFRTTPNGRLRTTVLGVFHADYRILELDEQYEWALVGSSMPLRLHVLSRHPHMDRATFRHILALAERRGYPLNRLRLLQTPE